LEIYRQRLDRNIHATLRQLRKLREESEPERDLTPSPCTQGEGRGEGCSSCPSTQRQMHPLPNPLPAYREREGTHARIGAGEQNEPTDPAKPRAGQDLSRYTATRKT